MSPANEVPVVFECAGERLLGIVAPGAGRSAVGVLILVGGRQYRAGSHRQFVLLSRRLTQAGHATFRFDFRGMGDSTGTPRHFESVGEDIAAAISTFQTHCPAVKRVVLWGLCDAATAAMLYCQATGDKRIAGLCLANPWFRSESGLARTRVRHYYRERFLDVGFWRKLVGGQVGVWCALKEYVTNLKAGRQLVAEARLGADAMDARLRRIDFPRVKKTPPPGRPRDWRAG